jgi:predicted RecA/RadA family phage recombinase
VPDEAAGLAGAVAVHDGVAQLEVDLVGVFDLKKTASQSWTVGDKVYWDNTAREVTKTGTGNTLIGVAVDNVGNSASETIGRVRLNASY